MWSYSEWTLSTGKLSRRSRCRLSRWGYDGCGGDRSLAGEALTQPLNHICDTGGVNVNLLQGGANNLDYSSDTPHTIM